MSAVVLPAMWSWISERVGAAETLGPNQVLAERSMNGGLTDGRVALSTYQANSLMATLVPTWMYLDPRSMHCHPAPGGYVGSQA